MESIDLKIRRESEEVTYQYNIRKATPARAITVLMEHYPDFDKLMREFLNYITRRASLSEELGLDGVLHNLKDVVDHVRRGK